MKSRLLPLALAVLWTTSACGPETASGVKLDSEAVNVLFGSKATPTAPVTDLPAAPGANPTPRFPTFIEPPIPFSPTDPVPSSVPVPRVSVSPCPTEARAGLKEQAPQTITKRPAEASYAFKTTATSMQTLPQEGPELYAEGMTTRTVAHVRDADATTFGAKSFLFDVVEQAGTATLTTTYLVSPEGLADEASEAATGTGVFDKGMYLYGTQRVADEGVEAFTPLTPLLILPFPVLEAVPWRSTATDPRSQISYQVDGQVLRRQRLNFCGQGVDSWRVQLTGRIAGPGRLTTVRDFTFDVGTQYGGLLMSSSLTVDEANAEAPYTSTQTSTILAEPRAAR